MLLVILFLSRKNFHAKQICVPSGSMIPCTGRYATKIVLLDKRVVEKDLFRNWTLIDLYNAN